MKIEILYSPQCGNYEPVLELIEDILFDNDIIADIKLVKVENDDDAQRLKFLGSPTVRVDGVDVEPNMTFGKSNFGLCCRSYNQDGQELKGPSRRMVEDTIEVGHLAELNMLGRCC